MRHRGYVRGHRKRVTKMGKMFVNKQNENIIMLIGGKYMMYENSHDHRRSRHNHDKSRSDFYR